MSDENDQGQDQGAGDGGDGGNARPETFQDRVERAKAGLRWAHRDDLAEKLEGVYDAGDLHDDPELLDAIGGVAHFGQDILSDFEPDLTAAREEAEAEAEQLEQDRVKTIEDEAREAIAKERAERAKAEELEAARVRILAEEVVGNGSPSPTTAADIAQRIIDESVAIVRDHTRPIEERAEAADRGIRAAADLEAISGSFRPDREALETAAAQRLKKIQEG